MAYLEATGVPLDDYFNAEGPKGKGPTTRARCWVKL